MAALKGRAAGFVRVTIQDELSNFKQTAAETSRTSQKINQTLTEGSWSRVLNRLSQNSGDLERCVFD